MRLSILMLIVLLTPLIAHCGKQVHRSRSVEPPGGHYLTRPMADFCDSSDSTDQESCLWWKQKVATDLLGPKGAALSLDEGPLASLSREAFVDRLMNREEFALTILDFNLYHLGFKEDPQFGAASSPFDGRTSGFPHALSSAKALQEDGNYLRLFRMEHPAYVTRMRAEPFLEQDELEELEDPENATPGDKRRYLENKFLTSLLTVKQYVDANANEDKATLCEGINGGINQDALFRLGYPFQLMIPMLFDEEWLAPVFFYCAFDMERPPLAKILQRSHDGAKEVFANLSSLAEQEFEATTFSEVKEVAVEELSLQSAGSPFGFLSFWVPLQNSSTNYNRRRAAYILDRYFCDDLTPVDVALPVEHSKGRHGDDPSCMSCHYKLDPMAGFFRHHGVSGINFKNYDGIFFDDGARKDMADYLSHWEDPEEGFGIGYIRSAKDTSKNEYGSDLKDLFEIIRNAPESRLCIAERLFEYFVDGEQTIDRGFLQETAQPLIETSEKASAGALKQVVRKIMLSRTYSTRDRDPEQCYDYASGTNPDNRPPCQVAAVLEANCQSCHNSTNARGGLDLSVWERLEDGYGFRHIDSDGAILEPNTSKQRMLDRITTGEENLRMPLQKHMSSKDRELLFLWLNDELNSQEGDR